LMLAQGGLGGAGPKRPGSPPQKRCLQPKAVQPVTGFPKQKFGPKTGARLGRGPPTGGTVLFPSENQLVGILAPKTAPTQRHPQETAGLLLQFADVCPRGDLGGPPHLRIFTGSPNGTRGFLGQHPGTKNKPLDKYLATPPNGALGARNPANPEPCDWGKGKTLLGPATFLNGGGGGWTHQTRSTWTMAAANCWFQGAGRSDGVVERAEGARRGVYGLRPPRRDGGAWWKTIIIETTKFIGASKRGQDGGRSVRCQNLGRPARLHRAGGRLSPGRGVNVASG